MPMLERATAPDVSSVNATQAAVDEILATLRATAPADEKAPEDGEPAAEQSATTDPQAVRQAATDGPFGHGTIRLHGPDDAE
jgi:hypothetical protein